MDRVKRRPMNFQQGVDNRQLRAHRRSVDRRQSRQSIFDQRRLNLISINEVPEVEEATPVPEQEPSAAGTSRRERLKRWKDEKALKKKLETEKKAEKPVFKVCRVKHEPAPYLPVTNVTVPSRRRPLAATSNGTSNTEVLEKRITRSTTARANVALSKRLYVKSDEVIAKPNPSKQREMKLTSNIQTSATIMHEADISFAPQNFQFVAPIGLHEYSTKSLEIPKTADSFSSSCHNHRSPPRVILEEENEDQEERSTVSAKEDHSNMITDNVLSATMTDLSLGVPHFRQLLQSNIAILRRLCDEWSIILDKEEAISDTVVGHIRSVVGKANLLMNERFDQFSKLIDDCQFRRGDKVTNCTDLEGFWEMFYPQVEDCLGKFQKLDRIRANCFQDEETPLKTMKKPKRILKPVGQKAGGDTKKTDDGERRRAARERLAEFKRVAAELNKNRENLTVVEADRLMTGDTTSIESSVELGILDPATITSPIKSTTARNSLCRIVLEKNFLADTIVNSPKRSSTKIRRESQIFTPVKSENPVPLTRSAGLLYPFSTLDGLNIVHSNIISSTEISSPKLNRKSDLIRFSDVFSESDNKENAGQKSTGFIKKANSKKGLNSLIESGIEN